MCLAVPARVVSIDNFIAEVELGGLIRKANIMLVPDVAVGDYILLHAGFAIQKLNKREAEETLRIFDDIAKEVTE